MPIGRTQETTYTSIFNELFLKGLLENASQLAEGTKLMGEKIAADFIDSTIREVLITEINDGRIKTAEQLKTRISQLTKKYIKLLK